MTLIRQLLDLTYTARATGDGVAGASARVLTTRCFTSAIGKANSGTQRTFGDRLSPACFLQYAVLLVPLPTVPLQCIIV